MQKINLIRLTSKSINFGGVRNFSFTIPNSLFGFANRRIRDFAFTGYAQILTIVGTLHIRKMLSEIPIVKSQRR